MIKNDQDSELGKVIYSPESQLKHPGKLFQSMFHELADPPKLSIAVLNLLDNAVKFNETNDTIRISASHLKSGSIGACQDHCRNPRRQNYGEIETRQRQHLHLRARRPDQLNGSRRMKKFSFSHIKFADIERLVDIRQVVDDTVFEEWFSYTYHLYRTSYA